MLVDMILGFYYLHTNGDLIWKPASALYHTTIKDYFDSPFVVKYWIIPRESPTGDRGKDIMWTMDWLYEALKLSQNVERTKKRIQEICESNKFPPIIAEAIFEKFSGK